MQLGREWNRRIEIWCDELRNDIYTTLGTSDCEGFTVYEMLTAEEAMSRKFVPMPSGTPWGRKWEYGWFRAQVCLSALAEGRRVVFRPDTGGETLVWVNGEIRGSKDIGHEYITLTRNGQAGETFHILMETYGGHGPRLENGGPYPPGRISVPEPPEFQTQTGISTYAVCNEEAYQLSLDVYTLTKLLAILGDKTLRAQKVADGLKQFTYIVDFEQPLVKRLLSYAKAREALAPLLACVNGSTMPVFTVFGQSHLDLAWKWPWEETKRKCARTLSAQLALMDEYPEYRFMLCEPPILNAVKQYYPALYKRVQKKIANGQFIPEGGFYVESDTNIPGGEALIRQFTYGKKWFAEETGTDTLMAWLPDSFGFTAALPQILIGCGIKYFGTQKILRSHQETDQFPYNIFMWEGNDGTAILSHMFRSNNSGIDPFLLHKRWEQDRNQQENIDTFLFSFGLGDGGGGPTREIYELSKRVIDLEGVPRTKLQSPIDFFRDIEERCPPKNRYVGEMYLQWHRGVYTSMARLKKANRRSETALREAELWAAAASFKGNFSYPAQDMTRLWKSLLFNHFHDVISGTSIERVHQESLNDHAAITAESLKISQDARRSLIKAGQGLVAFNSLSWKRVALLPLPDGRTGAMDSDGNHLPTQVIEGVLCAEADLPPCGYATIYPAEAASLHTPDICQAYRQDDSFVLVNDLLRVSLNPTGQISSILDLESGFEIAAGLCNNFMMYKDVNIEYDAWEIGSMYEQLPVELSGDAEITPLYSGGLSAGIRVTRKINNSSMSQLITLAKGKRLLKFKTEIDWQETHKLLKVNFPVRVHADEAIHEIQFGYVKRPTHKSRRYDADRYEVSQHRYTALAEAGHGCAVLNDCKYGVNVCGNSINLTLLKAPVIPDAYSDTGLQTFTYALYPYNGAFADSGVTQSGYELNTPVYTEEGTADSASLFEISAENGGFRHQNILLDTVKLADDGSGDIVLRLYESQNNATECQLRTALNATAVWQTDMKEEGNHPLKLENGVIKLMFRPFEVKTLRIRIPENK